MTIIPETPKAPHLWMGDATIDGEHLEVSIYNDFEDLLKESKEEHAQWVVNQICRVLWQHQEKNRKPSYARKS
jgi:hypothetical protein